MHKRLGRTLDPAFVMHVNARTMEFASTHRSFANVPLPVDRPVFLPVLRQDSDQRLIQLAHAGEKAIQAFMDTLKGPDAGPVELRPQGIRFKSVNQTENQTPAVIAAENHMAENPGLDVRRLRKVLLVLKAEDTNLVSQQLYDAAQEAELQIVSPDTPATLVIGICSVLSSKRGEMGAQIEKRVVRGLPPAPASPLLFLDAQA